MKGQSYSVFEKELALKPWVGREEKYGRQS